MTVNVISRVFLRIAVYVLFMVTIFFGVTSCDSKQNNSTQDKSGNLPEVVNISRLICGGHLPLAIVEKKYHEQLKALRLNIVQSNDWNDVITDLESGKVSGAFILSPLAMNMIHQGFPGKIVLMADRNGNGFVLSKNIKSIDDLKNHTSIIAVPHNYSQHHVLLHMVLKQHGIPQENVKVLGMPPRDMINSLRNGEIDGFVVGEPESSKSIDLGVGWMAAISPEIWKDHMDHVFLATNSFIQDKPEQLQELINQLVRGAEFIENHPHEAAVMAEDYTGSSAAIFEKVLTTPSDRISYNNMFANVKDMTSMAEKLVEMGFWTSVPEDINSAYFDMSFVEKAEQQMRKN